MFEEGLTPIRNFDDIMAYKYINFFDRQVTRVISDSLCIGYLRFFNTLIEVVFNSLAVVSNTNIIYKNKFDIVRFSEVCEAGIYRIHLFTMT